MSLKMKGQIPCKSKLPRPSQLLGLLLILLMAGCTPPPAISWENVNEEGAFLVYRRQSQIGEEQYSITSDKESIIVKSLQGENERGRITGVAGRTTP